MLVRKSMTIIVLPNIKMFHFTERTLAGIRSEAWYPYHEGKLFEYVEKYLVDAGIARNVARLDETLRCGESIDYLVTYNEFELYFVNALLGITMPYTVKAVRKS